MREARFPTAGKWKNNLGSLVFPMLIAIEWAEAADSAAESCEAEAGLGKVFLRVAWPGTGFLQLDSKQLVFASSRSSFS